MSAAAPPAASAPKFTQGSTLRHVVVMTATGSIGLMAIFLVDFLNLFYIALLGQAELAAAIGYAGTLLFFTVSLCIGISISGTALVSRALGARRRDEARRLATSSLVFMAAVTLVLTLATLPLLSPILTLFGATGRTHEIAWRFLLIVMPTTPLMGLGMACSGLLRAVGDAKRAMYVTLAGGVITAVFDPLLIFGFGLGVDGAAITSVFARLGLIALGFNGCIRVHNLLARPDFRAAMADARALSGIAVPAVLANIATPFGNAIVTAAVARYGDSAVAGYAVIGRIIPLAFGAIFALAGSIGPILGQNLGAERYDRVRRALLDGMTFTTVYCIAMCLVLVVLRESIVQGVRRDRRRRRADPVFLHLYCAILDRGRLAVRRQRGLQQSRLPDLVDGFQLGPRDASARSRSCISARLNSARPVCSPGRPSAPWRSASAPRSSASWWSESSALAAQARRGTRFP